MIKSLNGRHDDRGAAFDAGVRFFERHSAAAGDFGRFRGEGLTAPGVDSRAGARNRGRIRSAAG